MRQPTHPTACSTSARTRSASWCSRGSTGHRHPSSTSASCAASAPPLPRPGRSRPRRWNPRSMRCAGLRGRNGTRGSPARRGDDGGGARSARRRALPHGSGPRDRILAQGPLGRGRGPLRGSRRGLGLPGGERADGGPGRRQPGTGAPRAGAARRARDSPARRAPPRQPQVRPPHRARGGTAGNAALARSGAGRACLSRRRCVAGAGPAPHGR